MPPQNTHEIFRKELELFDKEVFGYSMNEYSEQGDKIRPIMCNREDAKSFLLSSLKRASLAVVKESVPEERGERYDMYNSGFDTAIERTLTTAKTITSPNTGTLQG